MFWLIYLSLSVLTCLILARLSKSKSFELFILFLVVFITPTQIETSKLEYAPAIFTYIFNILFEQNFSLRVLRPLQV